MSYVTNTTILSRYITREAEEELTRIEYDRDSTHRWPVGFQRIDKYAGGGKVYESDIFAAGSNYLDIESILPELARILKGCYEVILYSQTEEYPCRIWKLENEEWVLIHCPKMDS